MSILKNAKEFFGLSPMDEERDDAYYAETPRYETAGSAAYQPRTYDYEREPYEPAPAPAIAVVRLRSYKEAAEVGQPFRDGDAVIIDMEDMETAEARRVIDFAAGLCYALRGKMEQLSARVFALVPEGAPMGTHELKRAAHIH